MAAPRGFQDHFSGVAVRYSESRPSYPTALYEFVAKMAPATERAWDCATGNGQAAVGLSPYFEEVFATDASHEQIANAAHRDNVIYSVQLAENTNFPARYFDAVTVAQALHWFDLGAFIIELGRVLKSKAVVAAWTYGFFRISEQIDDIVRAEFFEPISSFWPQANAAAWSGYRGVKIPFQRIDTPKFAMACRWNLDELLNYLSTWSAATRYIEKNGPGLIDKVGAEIGAVWGEPRRKRAVDMDFYLRAWRND